MMIPRKTDSMTVDQAASYLGMPKDVLKKKIQDGKIRSYMIDGQTFILMEVLKTWKT